MRQRFDHRWIRVAIFFSVALVFSYLARVQWKTSDLADARHGVWGIYLHLISGIGPFLGAVLVWVAFRPDRSMSFGGTFPAMGLAMLAMPALVMDVMGVPNGFGVEAHVFGVHVGVWIALYAVLEETGWRGYLQGEFGARPAMLRYAIVGAFWYVWHLTFLTDFSSVGQEATNLLFIVLASIGIGFVADRTHSIFAAAAFHVIGNVLLTSVEFKAFMPSGDIRVRVVVICVVVWLIMLRLWRIRDNRIGARTALAAT